MVTAQRCGRRRLQSGVARPAFRRSIADNLPACSETKLRGGTRPIVSIIFTPKASPAGNRLVRLAEGSVFKSLCLPPGQRSHVRLGQRTGQPVVGTKSSEDNRRIHVELANVNRANCLWIFAVADDIRTLLFSDPFAHVPWRKEGTASARNGG